MNINNEVSGCSGVANHPHGLLQTFAVCSALVHYFGFWNKRLFNEVFQISNNTQPFVRCDVAVDKSRNEWENEWVSCELSKWLNVGGVCINVQVYVFMIVIVLQSESVGMFVELVFRVGWRFILLFKWLSLTDCGLTWCCFLMLNLSFLL